MAVNSKAIELLFGVAGGGSISGETGSGINRDIQAIVNSLNSSNAVKIKFSIDESTIKKQIASLKNELQSVVSKTSSGSGSGGGESHQKSAKIDYNDVEQATKAFVKLQKAQADLDKNKPRVGILGQETIDQLQSNLDSAKQKFQEFGADAQRSAKLSEDGIRAQITAAKSGVNATQAWARAADKANRFLNDNAWARRNPEIAGMMNNIQTLTKGGPENFDKLNNAVGQTQQRMRELGITGQTWGQKLIETFGSRLRTIFTGFLVASIGRYMRQLVTNVKEINGALTQLKIITGASEAQMNKFLSRSTVLAKELGVSIKDVLASVETFSRLGYDLEESTTLSKYASILSRVAAVNSDDATKGLTSIIKGYSFDPSDAERISDVLVTVGQKYAVSASELMEAFEKAGASLNASHTSFEKSAGLIAAANAAIQDASVVGTAIKTVSARIRKSKTDLDSLGESADDLAKAWSVYADEIQSLTGFNIMTDESKTQFKDLYDIFEGLSNAINKLGNDAQTTRARVAEILGGSRQNAVIESILQNWGDAAGAYTDAMNSAGASTKAMNEHVNSIPGKIEQLKASFEEFSNSVLSSDLVKVVVDILKWGVSALNTVAKITDKVIGLKNAIVLLGAVLVLINGKKILSKMSSLVAWFPKIIAYVKDLKLGIQLAGDEGYTGMHKLSAGFKVATTSAQGLTIAVSAITAAITIIVSVIHMANQAREESIQRSIEASQQASDEAKNNANLSESLNDLIEQYKELRKANGGSLDSQAAETARGIQEKIKDLVGDQADALDLVNGKLEDEYEILNRIKGKQSDIAQTTAEGALKSAETAILNTTDHFGVSWEHFWNTRFRGKYLLGFGKYGGIKKDGRGYIETRFSNAEDFADQYEAVLSYLEEFIENYDPDNEQQRNTYNALNGFLNDYKDIYEPYADARRIYNSIVNAVNDSNEPVDEKPDSVAFVAKTAIEHLDALQEKYDAITKALQEMEDQGYLSSDSLKSLYDLGLDNYVERTEDGFKIVSTALDDFVTSYINARAELYDNSKESEEDFLNLQAVLGTLSITSISKYLEKEKKALNDQLDAYKELIDLRKELLKQYKEELDYQEELEERQNKVTSLQSKYIVSQLDKSAAGQARTRELRKELDDAKKDLDDFTLQHAIDVLTNELDNQYEEYKSLVSSELETIEQSIQNLYSDETIGRFSTAIANAMSEAKEKAEELPSNEPPAHDIDPNAVAVSSDPLLRGRPTAEEHIAVSSYEAEAIQKKEDAYEASQQESVPQESGTIYPDVPIVSEEDRHQSYGAVTVNGQKRAYSLDDVLAMARGNSDDAKKSSYMTYATAKIYGYTYGLSEEEWYKAFGKETTLAGFKAGQYENKIPKASTSKSTGGNHSPWTTYEDAAKVNPGIATRSEWSRRKQGYATYQDYLDGMYKKYVGSYHVGGIVDTSPLKSTEVFAKLLKGEFVATPAMMQKFVGQTLPAIASSSNSTNEFNAPLITIQCDSVTQESLPRLEEIVNGAVQKIKKELDGGMSRNGYRKQATKI